MSIALLVVAIGLSVGVVALERERRRLRDAAARSDAAARISIALAEADDVRRDLPGALRHLLPTFADWCTLHVIGDDGPRRIAVVHADPARERRLLDTFSVMPFDPEGPTGPARVIRSGEPELVVSVSSEHIARQVPLLQQLAAEMELGSFVTVPVKERRRTIGAFTLARDRHRQPFTPDEMSWAQDVAHRIGLAIENARLYADARDLFEQTLTANFVSTPDGRILACNHTFARLLGFETADEVLKMPATMFYPADEDREKFLADLRERKRLVGYELTVRRRDGRSVAIAENAVGTFDDRGELVRITGFIVDRTAQKELEEQLRQSQRLEAVGRLAGGVAHDFNNLLTVIVGCVDLLREERPAPPPDMHDPLEEITKASRRAAALTHQLLAFSRRQVLQPRLIDLNEALRNIHSMLRRVVRENVVLVLDLNPALHRLKVDPGQLDQVIMNLVVNANDAIPGPGTITLVTSNVRVGHDAPPPHQYVSAGNYVCLEVRDTGVGMDETTRARVFEPFFTTKPLGKGTGLGLSTVYGIVKQSGGHVWLDSSSGVGTTVTVYLPDAAT